MTTFKPADNYSDLKRQALALNNLLNSKQAQISSMQKQIELLTQRLALCDQAALDAERSINASLTQSLLDAESLIETLTQSCTP